MRKNLEETVKLLKSNTYQILDSKLEKAKKDVNGHSSYVCPFCNHGKNGDGLTVIPDTNLIHCFGCNFTGSVIDLFMKSENKNFLETVTELSSLQGIELNNDISELVTEDIQNVITEPKEENLEEYYKQTKDYFLNSPMAQNYLYRRGIHLETALSTGCIGFDPQSDPARNNHHYPRILFFKGERGILSHYNARIVEDDSLHVLDRKYAKLKPKGLSEKGFFNGQVLEEKNNDYKTVFVCEGEFDCISFMEINKPAIALSSKSRGKAFVDFLKSNQISHDKQLIVTLDNDTNEQTNIANRAEERELVEELNKLGYKTISYPVSGKYKDCNECLIKDRNYFMEQTEKAMKEIGKDDFEKFLDEIQSDIYNPIRTGMQWFDNVISGGFMEQTVTLLLASPATGKTTLCQQIAEKITESGREVVYMNLEMSNAQMYARDISRMLKKDKNIEVPNSDVLRLKGLKSADKTTAEEVIDTANKYHKTTFKRLHYVHGVNDIADIMSVINSKADKCIDDGGQAPVVFIDYLHYVADKENQQNDERIKHILQELKNYAISYNTFVIIIGATNRTSNGGKISLSSGRDSSNIEYTADTVLSMDYKALEENGNMSQEELSAEQAKPLRKLIIRNLKQRNGVTGRETIVYFNTKACTFYGENDPKIKEVVEEDRRKNREIVYK